MARASLRAYEDLDLFEADVRDFLMAQEAANCLPLGLLAGMRQGEWETPLLATVSREASGGVGGRESIVLVAIRTPPHNLILCASAPEHALEPLLDHLERTTGPAGLPGVLGPERGAAAFAEIWSRRTGLKARLRMAQRIFRCDAVEPVTGVPGSLRPATETDSPIVRSWFRGFLAEAMPGMPFDADDTAARWLRSPARSLWFWTHRERAVSMVGASGPTPNGIRVSAVYTPAEHRRRGYASAAVANVTQRMLDEGRAFCTLFTDLSNPTSNKIYQQVGYRPVIDFPLYTFEGPETDRPASADGA